MKNTGPDKLYIAVRADLPAGLQMAQAVHAAFQFAVAHPVATREWHFNSNYLVIVAVPDEATLNDLAVKALALGIGASPVVEPDMDSQMTAIAFTPGDAARRLLSQYPLALREAAMP
jgi:peptidyl-tRNA hydrolase